MQQYPHFLSPLDLGYTKLRNRSLMGSMHTALEETEGGGTRVARSEEGDELEDASQAVLGGHGGRDERKADASR